MRTASIRDLRNSFPTVAKWIEEGESVEITRSGIPFARLSPVPPAISAIASMPDFLGRIRDKFPDERLSKNFPNVVDYDRGDR